MSGEVINKLPRYCHMTREVIIQLPNTVSILNYDRKSHHPATRILFLYCHMRGEVIIQLPGYCHMTGEVIIQLTECFYADI
jgi:hypothetical protein